MYTISQNKIEYFELSSSSSAQIRDLDTIDGADLDDRGFYDVLPESSPSLYLSPRRWRSYRGLFPSLFLLLVGK